MTADLATLLSTRSRVLVKVIFQYLPSDQLIQLFSFHFEFAETCKCPHQKEGSSKYRLRFKDAAC